MSRRASATCSVAELLDAHAGGHARRDRGGRRPVHHDLHLRTTGAPKGVPAPVRVIAGCGCTSSTASASAEDDVYWCAADPGWAYGLYCAIVAPLAAGHTTIAADGGFRPDLTWQVLDHFEVTNFAAAPTVYRALRAAAAEVPAGWRCGACPAPGSRLTPTSLHWAEEALGVEIRDHYGQTEHGMVVVNGWHHDIRRRAQARFDGHAVPGWTCRGARKDSDEIAPAGELGRVAIDIPNSPAMSFTGYHEAPEKTAERIHPGRALVRHRRHRQPRRGRLLLLLGPRRRRDHHGAATGSGPSKWRASSASTPTSPKPPSSACPTSSAARSIEAFVVLRGRSRTPRRPRSRAPAARQDAICRPTPTRASCTSSTLSRKHAQRQGPAIRAARPPTRRARSESMRATHPTSRAAAVAPRYRSGTGEPLVLLHCAWMNWRAWTPVLPLLASGRDVLAPTLPGHLGGPKPPSARRADA